MKCFKMKRIVIPLLVFFFSSSSSSSSFFFPSKNKKNITSISLISLIVLWLKGFVSSGQWIKHRSLGVNLRSKLKLIKG